MSTLTSEEAILVQALRLAGDERQTFVEEQTRGNPTLRQRIESLLANYEAGAFLEEAADPSLKETIFQHSLGEKPGDWIGRYKLLEQIGEGGCGVVYVAAQHEPVKRRVALKIIKLGMDTKSVVARFEAEQQALALMDHPNIAKVFDAGATDSGRPYFVMELVRGMKITDYCDEAELSIRERLELFIQVCQAIQHAHQKGIIHRDIKPPNVLVTVNDGVPIPKVIDFGIAKATNGQRLTDQTIYTAFEQFIGTPAYMSPEQSVLTSVDIDTRSDIYALGVLLYELLTGNTPFDSKELLAIGLEEMRRTIREREPARPSTRLRSMADKEASSAAQRRGVTLPRLVSDLGGDLDWIVMRALEKDRARRYETANGLAMDVRRHLSNEPVVARSPSNIYRLQKLVRRHRVGFASAGVMVAALLIGLVLFAWEFIDKSKAYERAVVAEREQNRLREAADKSRLDEERQRKRAEGRAYASDMNLAQQALAMNNLGRAEELLNRHRPSPDSQIRNSNSRLDLRGWEWRYLWQQCQSAALFTLCHQEKSISSVGASSDGRWLATIESKGAVSIWDLRTHRQVSSLPPGTMPRFATFSPRESIIAFSTATGPSPTYHPYAVHVWDFNARQLVCALPLEHWCCGLAFSEDGRRLVTATTDGNQPGRITIWEVPSGRELASYPAPHTDEGTTFAATADLTKAAHETPNRRGIRVLDLQTGKECWTAEAASEGHYVMSVAFSPDGRTLVSGTDVSSSDVPSVSPALGADRGSDVGNWDIRVWDVASGRQIGRLWGHTGWVGNYAFWPDGKTLASASADQTICLWDLATMRLRTRLRGHRQGVLNLALLPDQRTLISGGADGSVCFWDTSSPERKRSRILLSGGVLAWRIDPDDQSVLTAQSQGNVVRWKGPDFETQQVLLDLGPKSPGVYFTPDARFVAADQKNGFVEVWDLRAGSLLYRLAVRGRSPGQRWAGGHWISSHGNRLFLGYWGAGSLQEWDLETGKELPSWTRPGSARCGAISPDGGRCLTFGWDGKPALRQILTRTDSFPDLPMAAPWDVAFSPDGSLLAAVSMYGYPGDLSGYLKIWDASSFRELAAIGGFRTGALSVAFSPDSTRLAAGEWGPEAIKLWDSQTHQQLLTLGEVPSDVATSIAFSPDGNMLGALNTSLGAVQLWRAPSWSDIESAERSRKNN